MQQIKWKNRSNGKDRSNGKSKCKQRDVNQYYSEGIFAILLEKCTLQERIIEWKGKTVKLTFLNGTWKTWHLLQLTPTVKNYRIAAIINWLTLPDFYHDYKYNLYVLCLRIRTLLFVIIIFSNNKHNTTCAVLM